MTVEQLVQVARRQSNQPEEWLASLALELARHVSPGFVRATPTNVPDLDLDTEAL